MNKELSQPSILLAAPATRVYPWMRNAGIVLGGSSLAAVCAHIALPLYFTPVPLSMAPAASQKVIQDFGRPEYASAIADNKQELPLLPDKLVYAFSRWDEQVGAQKKK